VPSSVPAPDMRARACAASGIGAESHSSPSPCGRGGAAWEGAMELRHLLLEHAQRLLGRCAGRPRGCSSRGACGPDGPRGAAASRRLQPARAVVGGLPRLGEL
jgi:hypothetical protein